MFLGERLQSFQGSVCNIANGSLSALRCQPISIGKLSSAAHSDSEPS